MAQNPRQPTSMFQNAQGIMELITTLQTANQNAGIMTRTLANSLAAHSAQNAACGITYNATTPASSGAYFITSSVTYCTMITVTVPSSGGGTGFVYDSASVANATSSNSFAVIPSCGSVNLDWPLKYGLVVQPSSQSQVVSVSYI